jgi:glucose 1-dehydrogenase
MKLSNKVVVVTGSTRGIGAGIAAACARAGAKVVVSSRNSVKVEAVIAELGKEGLAVSGIAADVSDPNGPARLLEHAIATWGRVDVWINNAGLSTGFRPVSALTDEEIVRTVNVNFVGTLRACRLVLSRLIQQGGGILINVSGKGGRGSASPNLAVYAATKAAVSSLTKSLAEENKSQPVSIHTLMPGMVETDFYKDIETSPDSAAGVAGIPYILKAIGVPVGVVSDAVVNIAAQEPGKVTGKTYSLFKGRRLIKGIAMMSWYRLTGKIK